MGVFTILLQILQLCYPVLQGCTFCINYIMLMETNEPYRPLQLYLQLQNLMLMQSNWIIQN
jgi:hypothetical protein